MLEWNGRFAKAEEQGRWQQVHQKRRRLANLKSRLAGPEPDIAAGRQRFVRRTALNGETILLALWAGATLAIALSDHAD